MNDDDDDDPDDDPDDPGGAGGNALNFLFSNSISFLAIISANSSRFWAFSALKISKSRDLNNSNIAIFLA